MKLTGLEYTSNVTNEITNCSIVCFNAVCKIFNKVYPSFMMT